MQKSTAGRREVVVTGCGTIAPNGHTVESFWSSLVAGRSGIGSIQGFDTDGLPVRIAGEIREFDATEYIPKHTARRMDPFTQYGVAAAAQAVAEAKLEVTDDIANRVGVYLGSAAGACKLSHQGFLGYQERGQRGINSFYFATSGMDTATNEVAMRFGACGPSACLSTACATGATCIGEAAQLIRSGETDVMIAGGTDDPITPVEITSAANARALSRNNDDPQGACRPFDQNRDGFVMGSGAGVVVLEDAEFAQRRGAHILCELAGYSATTDAYHMTQPHPDGIGSQRAMRTALADAGITTNRVDHINAHGTGTSLNDSIETAAIRSVFGSYATEIPITSIKSMTGHMLGAGGAAELIATIMTLRTGTVSPTINCDSPEDPEMNYVTGSARQVPVEVGLSNSFGFGGHNAVLVVTSRDT